MSDATFLTQQAAVNNRRSVAQRKNNYGGRQQSLMMRSSTPMGMDEDESAYLPHRGSHLSMPTAASQGQEDIDE